MIENSITTKVEKNDGVGEVRVNLTNCVRGGFYSTFYLSVEEAHNLRDQLVALLPLPEGLKLTGPVSTLNGVAPVGEGFNPPITCQESIPQADGVSVAEEPGLYPWPALLADES